MSLKYWKRTQRREKLARLRILTLLAFAVLILAVCGVEARSHAATAADEGARAAHVSSRDAGR
ncbi:MAG TPA: hypothetical protein VIG54_06520 [Lysobacter sp.]